MSTNYNALNPFFSSIRVDNNGHHSKITLFNKGQNIGTLCIDAKDEKEFIPLFFTREDVVRTFDGHVDYPVDMPETTQLLSEYGELVKLSDVKK